MHTHTYTHTHTGQIDFIMPQFYNGVTRCVVPSLHSCVLVRGMRAMHVLLPPGAFFAWPRAASVFWAV